MAGSVNKVILVGNLGRDPEVRHTQNNQKIVQLSVATSERWKDRQSGEARERTEWHRVVIFNENLGDTAERFLRKGSPVYLEGQLQTRTWTDQAGQEHSATEVVLSRFKGELTLLGGRASSGAEGGSPEEVGDAGYRPLCAALRPLRARGVRPRWRPARAADQRRGAVRRRGSVLAAPCWACAGVTGGAAGPIQGRCRGQDSAIFCKSAVASMPTRAGRYRQGADPCCGCWSRMPARQSMLLPSHRGYQPNRRSI